MDVMEEPLAKRHHRCSSPRDGEEEDWSAPMRCSTPVRQLEGEGELAGPLDELDEEVEHEGDGDDVLSIASEEGGLDYFGLNEESIVAPKSSCRRYYTSVEHQLTIILRTESFICEVESEEPSLNWLPWEVLEVVFCQLPLVELFTGCRLVCKRWNDIIMREKFLLWKKRYHMAKSGRCPPATVTVTHLLHEYEMVEELVDHVPYFSRAGALIRVHQSSCLVNMARFVGKEFESMEVGEGAMEVLRAHPQYPCVERIVELHPQLREGEETVGVIQTLSLLVVCCRSVRQVFALLLTLVTSDTREGGSGGFGTPICQRIPVTEVFYCLACLCYALWEKGVLPQRFHYFIFYSLNVLERGPSSGPATQPSCSQQNEQPHSSNYGLQLTSEQCKIINHPLRPGETVQVKAFAGTGKTTILRCFTALKPNWRFLYCVYNKSVQVHARDSVFTGGNVDCRTFHSLAYTDVGSYFRSNLLYNLSPHEVSKWVEDVPFMGASVSIKDSHRDFSKYVYETLLRFIASDSRGLTEEHLPRMDTLDADCADLVKVPGYYAAAVVREAKRIWRDMQNLKIRMPQDGYLKLYQLQNPRITGYDCILVDEAQDLTPAIISIVQAQSCAKVIVGDPHQQIYGFRMATNAMSYIPVDHTFHLTRSFRFGPEIAYTASCILEVLKGVRSRTIVGGLQPGGIQGEQSGQLAIITRCNDTLFVEMARVVESGKKLRLGFTGGNDKDKDKEKYEFDLLLDIHKLLQGKTNVSHGLVKRYAQHKAPFKHLKADAESHKDVALLKKIKICERFYRDLPTIVTKIRSMTCPDNSFADIVFSTAHKSKGLEFDTVKLTDDYLESHDFNDPYSYLPPDEKNLLYVAATRAKRQLIMTPTLLDVLHRAGEFFVYPSGSQETKQAEVVCAVCAVCSLMLPPPRLLLERTQIQLSNTPQAHKGGFVCKMCSYTVLPCFGSCL